MEVIIALILSIATEFGLPPYFVLAIAYEESNLNPLAVNVNENGTRDYGIMQLNSSWYKDERWAEPEVNIRAGCRLLKKLADTPEINTYWAVAVSYNAGTLWLKTGNPPDSSINYAGRVMARYNELTGGRALVVIKR